MPEPLLSRSPKGGYVTERYAGTRRHGGELLEVFGDRALARLRPHRIRAILTRAPGTTAR
ncbi:hypothetical protein [Streptosporangium jomthongense]|uniref:Uncharacterized protein n=1 Tax=Streptosporangium jomthongense TaxID=1193683 RepID=A0ABV8F7Q9_9ACTN